MNATARYVIAADDKTKAAIASINSGFRGMERNIKSAAGTLNKAFSLFAGFAAAQAVSKVFNATAKSSKEFATALDDVRDSARNLLASKEGVPGATDAMKELAETLKDPAVVAAADAITSALITGFGKTVTFIAEMTIGLQALFRMTGDEIEDLTNQIDDLDQKIRRTKAWDPDSPELTGLLAQREAAIKRQQDLLFGSPKRTTTIGTSFALDPKGLTLPDFKLPPLTIDTTAELNEMRDLRGIRRLREELERAGEMNRALFKDIGKEIEEGIGDTTERAAADVQRVADAFVDAKTKTTEWSVAADQAARNIQDAFANFLFDPFQDGLRGMLKGFIDLMRRIAAEKAAAKLFDPKSEGGFGLGDFFSGLFGGGVPGLATGTNFVPHDNFPALLHKGEAVIPAKFNPAAGGRGGTTFHMPINIDARGATQDAIKLLPGVVDRAVQRAKAELRDEKRRGTF